MIPGLDGRKMSKSYDNYIGLFEDDTTLKKKVMSIPTDDTPLEDAKDPDTCNVFRLIKFFATAEQSDDIRNKYLAGGYGYGHAKLELLEILKSYLTPFRERRAYYESHFDEILEKVQAGNERANALLDAKYDELKQIVGFD